MGTTHSSGQAAVHPAWDRTQPIWIVTLYGPGLIGVQDCALVHAPDPDTAAAYGAEALQAHLEDTADRRDEVVPVDCVHVMPVDGRVAFAVNWEATATPVPDEFQCCGGGGYDGGHSGHCTKVARDA